MVRAADAMFSKLVRAREPICAACKKEPTTDTAHHMPRGFFAVRWWFSNASGLCRACHRWFTARPLEWRDWWWCKVGFVVAGDVEAAARDGRDKRLAVEEALLAMRRAA